MFDGLYRNVFARETRSELNTSEMLYGGWNFVVSKVGSSEADAGTGNRRLQREANLVAGMKADPDTGNCPPNSAL
jgi:hypothetical protein